MEQVHINNPLLTASDFGFLLKNWFFVVSFMSLEEDKNKEVSEEKTNTWLRGVVTNLEKKYWCPWWYHKGQISRTVCFSKHFLESEANKQEWTYSCFWEVYWQAGNIYYCLKTLVTWFLHNMEPSIQILLLRSWPPGFNKLYQYNKNR